MDTYRTTIYVIAINLICLYFSTQAWANNRLEKPTQYSDDSISLSISDKPSNDYLWLKNQRLKSQTYEALGFIANSSHHGLNPNDYHYGLLLQIDPTVSETNAQRFEQLLTDGLLKLIHDITVGRLNPAVVDPKWSIPRTPFDAADFLHFALQGDYFKACLDALIPTSNQYQQIKAAATRYQDYVDRGDWPKIPKSPILHPGDFHQNLPLIRKRLAFENNKIASIASSQSNHYGEDLQQAVKHFQRRYSLKADGIIGPATRRAMNVSAAERLQQIKINLERIRWLPGDLGERYIMVNLANYRLT
ncbi:MAG: hypothetical protein GQ549_02460, partial [Gammaproteobacteria bacterium]|nr:hypothetical protein [Gammaproteobacteria bacterium]